MFLKKIYNSVVFRFNYKFYKVHKFIKSLHAQKALEIGGPSELFKENNLLPFYPHCKKITLCNFSKENIWAGDVQTEALPPVIGPIVSEICELTKNIALESQNLILASHVLEHTANPLRALKEIYAISKTGGIAVIIVPKINHIFDHKRPITTFEHLIADFESEITEDDLTHLDEILKHHDLELDPGAGIAEQFKERSKNNLQNRALHQHTFDLALLEMCMKWANFKILYSLTINPIHHICIGQKQDFLKENPRN